MASDGYRSSTYTPTLVCGGFEFQHHTITVTDGSMSWPGGQALLVSCRMYSLQFFNTSPIHCYIWNKELVWTWHFVFPIEPTAVPPFAACRVMESRYGNFPSLTYGSARWVVGEWVRLAVVKHTQARAQAHSCRRDAGMMGMA